jgi:hypothetical protein
MSKSIKEGQWKKKNWISKASQMEGFLDFFSYHTIHFSSNLAKPFLWMIATLALFWTPFYKNINFKPKEWWVNKRKTSAIHASMVLSQIAQSQTMTQPSIII